jgi:hypothetical protein
MLVLEPVAERKIAEAVSRGEFGYLQDGCGISAGP